MDMIPSSFWQSGALMSLDQKKVIIGYGKPQLAHKKAELDSAKPCFYYPDFFLRSPQPWRQYPFWEEWEIERLEEVLETEEMGPLQWKICHEEIFRQAFDDLQRIFADKLLEKAVPYTFAYASASMSSQRLKRCLKKALESVKQTACHVYGYWNEGEGVLGMTPEILFLYDWHEPSLVQTMALAGTCRKEEEDNLKQSLKEQREHAFVVEGIRQALKPFGTVSSAERRLLKLPTLTHLLTPMTVSLSQPFVFEDFVQALHPTPALGAFPKKEGWKWLLNYQTLVERAHYGAPAGLWHPARGLAACLVAIRQVQWNERGMRLGAGCGVVKESQYESEWKEISLKIEAVRKGLDL